MRDWSSGQILRTAIADAYRSRMGGANPICIDWFEIFILDTNFKVQKT